MLLGCGRLRERADGVTCTWLLLRFRTLRIAGADRRERICSRVCIDKAGMKSFHQQRFETVTFNFEHKILPHAYNQLSL